MENTSCGLHNFNSSGYLYPSTQEDSETFNQIDRICSLNLWLNRNVKDVGCEADQSTEEGVPMWVNSSDERILDLTKAIVNGDTFQSISIIKLITRPILMTERNMLTKLVEIEDLEDVKNALMYQFHAFSPIFISSKRRIG